MSEPTFWEWLTLPKDDLALYGIPYADVSRRRVRITGHERPLSKRWSRAVGSWGRVRTMREIATLLRVEVSVVKYHARALGLKFATRDRRVTQARLAVALWCDRQRDPKDSCRHFGVLRAERALYCTAVEHLMQEHGVAIADVLGWSVSRLDAEWAALGLEVGPMRYPPDWLDEPMLRANRIAVEGGPG